MKRGSVNPKIAFSIIFGSITKRAIANMAYFLFIISFAIKNTTMEEIAEMKIDVI